MNDVVDLTTAFAARDRKSLDAKDRWTPRDALVAALSDIDSGALVAEAICIVYSEPAEGGDASKVGRYVGSDGVSGKKENFWVAGMVYRMMTDWMS